LESAAETGGLGVNTYPTKSWRIANNAEVHTTKRGLVVIAKDCAAAVRIPWYVVELALQCDQGFRDWSLQDLIEETEQLELFD
jgi:hypothetical protein